MKRLAQQLERIYLRIDRQLGGRLTILIRTGLAFDQDDGAIVSRSIAYYALFSLFPLLLVLMSFSSSVLAVEEAQQVILELVNRYLPVATDLIQANIEQVLSARSTIGILALLGLIWSASGVFTAIYRAVNRAWGNPKSQLFWSEKLFGLAVVLFFGLLLLGTTFYSTILNVVQTWQTAYLDWQPLDNPGVSWLVDLLSTLIPPLVSVITFIVLYRTIPRNKVSWRDVWLGGLLAGMIWEAARRLYTWYLANFASYSLIYGSVGAIIGFLLWAYLGAQILLLGAEFSAQHTAWRQAGRPVESRRPHEWMNEWSK